jgi:ribonuclease P/MRP protein subunit POP5
MAKLKALLPTLRERKRFVAFEVLSKGKKQPFASVSRAIWHGMLSLNGVKGAAHAGMLILPEKYNEKRQRGIIRVNHTSVDALKAGMVMVQDIEKAPAIIRSVGVSGSLKKATTYVAG